MTASPSTYSPTSARPRGTAVFGAPLDVAVNMPNCPYDIPVVVEQCVSYLEAYRTPAAALVPAHAASGR